MYAFLSRVFGRKKDDKDASSSSQPVLSPGELLGGRFEAISPNVSPVAPFLEFDTKTNDPKDKDKEKEKDVGFSFFKGKWRPASPDVKPTRKLDVLPHLSLNFQEPRAASAAPDLGLLFTTDQILSDAVIGQRRLNPLEALVLVQACSQAIIAKGLETLGIMHPHWYAASQGIQRRVISHFIYLLDLEKLTSIPSPASPTSPISAFEAEVNDTLSPHDIAAILRWGLRHVQIEGDSFGTDDEWYKTFLEAESAAEYPPKAFSDKLAPLLPTTHLQLLTATLEIFSSLAAHAEVNGTSGSKLCKIFGLWLLTAHRVEDKGDWKVFYARWERTGRMLEHLFLSRIRDESSDQRMPVRLLELVRKYPYTKGLSSPTTDLPLLSPPPFTTRLHDAFFVRVTIELPYGKRKPTSKLHPLSLLADAFSTKVEGEYADLWAKITTASKDGDSSSFSNIFTDDTIRFLSLVPDEPIGHEVRSPTFSLVSPVSPFKRSFSVGDADKPEAIVAEHPKSATEPSTALSPLSNGIGSDWAQFSTSGFLETSPNIIPLASTLLDTDIEKTNPPDPVVPLSRKSSRRSKAASPSSPRKSIDMPRPETEISPEAKPEDIEEQKNIIKASQLQIIQLDEAFVDFWSDSLLDPINADWPTFIICKFNSSLVPELTFGVAEEGQKQKTIQWLVLEQVYTIRTPPVPPIPIETARRRPSSPSSQSTSGKKRFSFWSVSRTGSNSSATSHKGKKKEQDLKVGEMGELLEEQPKHETKGPEVKVKSPIFRSMKSLDITRKSAEQSKKSIIKPAEEPKIDEETTAVAVVAAAAVVASVSPVIANGFSTDGPHLVEGVTVRTEVDHRTDALAIEADSTPPAVTEAVVTSSEPTVKSHDILPFTTSSDVVSSLEAKVETAPLESDILVPESTTIAAEVEATEIHPESELQPKLAEAEPALLLAEGVVGTTTDSKDRSSPLLSVLEPEVVVEDVVETEGRVETDPIITPQADTVFVESEVANVTDAPPMATEAPATIEDIESISVSPQHGAIVAPLVAISKPEIDTEASVKPDSTSTTEESPAVSAPGPETSQVTEVAPAAVDHSPLTESEGTNVENEPEAIETEHVSVLVEGSTADVEEATVDVPTGETSDSALIHAAVQFPHEVAAQEVSQPQSDAILLDQVEGITALTEVERFGTAEDIEAKDTVIKEEKHDFVFPPALHEVTNLEPETEASAEPAPASIEQGSHTNIEPEATHSDEQAAVAESQPEVELDENAELQPELEQETTTAQEIGVDVVSASKDASIAVVANDVEAKVTAESHGTEAPNATNDVAAESTEAEHVIPATEDSTEHENEAFTKAVRSATPEDISSMDKPEPEVTHEMVLEAENDSVENGTTREPQWKHQVDDTATVVEDTIPDIQTSLRSDSTPLEPEIRLTQTEVESEIQIEAASMPTTEGVPIDMEIQPDNPTEIAPNIQKDIEVDSRAIDDSSNTKDEPISKSDIALDIEAEADLVRLEPEVDLVAPVAEEPSIVTRAEGENLAPRIGSEVAQSPDETSPSLEDESAFVVNIEDQIVTPVDVQLEHAALVETSRTDELVEAVLPSVEERLENLEPIVEPSYESPDDETVGSHIIPEVDAVVPEAQVLGEGEPVLATEEPPAPVELNMEQETDANMSQEPLMTHELEQSVTHEDVHNLNSPARHEALPIPEVNASIAIETESEPLSTDPVPEDKVPTLDVEEQHVLLSSESCDAANIESKDEIIPLATTEPELDVVTRVVAPVSETLEVQAQQSVEETTEEAYAVVVPETASAISEPTTVVSEDLQIENGGTAQAEEDLVDVPPADEKLIAPLVEFKATEIPSTTEPLVTEIASVVSEPATVIPEGLQIENGGIAQAEESSFDPPPTDDPVQEEPIAPLMEFKEAVEIPPRSVAEIASVISEPATVESEDLQIENNNIAQTENDLPLPTNDHVQEEAVAPLAGIEESVEISSTAEPSVAEITSVISGPATVVPEDLQIENEGVAQVEEDLVHRPPPTDDPVQEGAVAPLAEFKEAVEIPSTAEIPSDVSEPAIVVPEDLHIVNDSVAQAEAALVDPPPPTDSVQEKTVAPLAEPKEAVEIPSTAEIPPVVSELATVLPEDLHIENGSVAQAEAALVDPPPPTDSVQEKTVAPLAEPKEAVEIPSTAEIPPVVSELATVLPEDLHIENGSVAQPETDLVDPPPPIDDPLQEETVEIPSTADVTFVVSEQATVVPEVHSENDSAPQAEAGLIESPPTNDTVQESVTPLAEFKEVAEVAEDLHIENDDVVQAEADLVNPPPIDDTVQEKIVSPLAEFDEAVEIPPTAEIPSATSEVATEASEDLHLENDSVAQPETDLVDPPPIDDPLQEETVEIPSTADITPVVSEQAIVASEDLHLENGSSPQAEAGLIESPPTDDTVQENVAPLAEVNDAVEVPSTVEISPVVSELATDVPGDSQIENGNVAYAEADSIHSPPPIDDTVQQETIAPLAEFKEAAEVPSAAEVPPVFSELATVVPEDLQIEHDSVAQGEADLVDPPPIDDTVQEQTAAPFADSTEAAEVPSTADIESVVSELATVVPEDFQIESDSVAHAEAGLIESPPPIDDPVQENVAPLTEFKEAVEDPSTIETPPVVSDVATVVPEDLQIENDIAQTEADLVDPPPIDDTVQEQTAAPFADSEAAEVPSTAEIPLVVSELATVVPEDSQIENDSVSQVEADLIHSPPPIDDTVQEKTVAPLAEFNEAIEVPSTAEIPPVVSEVAITAPEDLQIEHDSVAQAEAALNDSPPPIDDTVQQETVTPLKEAVEVPSSTEIPPVISELATVVPEDLQTENDSVAQADLVDPPPSVDHTIQEVVNPLLELNAADTFSTAEPSVSETPSVMVSEPVAEDLQIENGSIAVDNTIREEPLTHAEFKEAVEIPSTTEPTEPEIAPAVSELSTMVPEDLSIDSGCIAQEGDLPPLRTVEPIGESTEGQMKAAIPETTIVEDMVVSQNTLSEVEVQSLEEAEVETPETHVSNDNKYSTTGQETNGTLDDSLEVTSDTTEGIKAEPMVTEPIHHLNISPVTLEPPSTTD